MNNRQKMKITWIDPDQRALYAAENPEGGFLLWAQKGKGAPKILRSDGYIDPDGYATLEEAQEALDHYVSYKRSSGTGMSYYRWEVIVNGKRTHESDYAAMCRNEMNVPDELPPSAPVTLANIEYRIALHIQGAYENVLEVGRCLNEAKESGFVPHGEWEGWVQRNTDMSERQAQRLMQAARSVSPGSMMERLPITKIQAILALPEPEREQMAEKTVDDNLSLRELQATVKALTSKVAIAEKKLNRAEQAVENARVNAYARAQEDWSAKVQELQSNIAALKDESATAQQGGSSADFSLEAREEIERLNKELQEAEAYAAQQAQQRQDAQREMLEMQSREARGDEQKHSAALTAYDLTAAVRMFIGTAGVLPHMGKELAVLDEAEKNAFRQQVDIIGRWLDGAEEALHMVYQVIEPADEN